MSAPPPGGGPGRKLVQGQGSFRRINWLKMAKKAGGLAFTAATGVPSPDLPRTALGAWDCPGLGLLLTLRGSGGEDHAAL